jgi:hypothetical protein
MSFLNSIGGGGNAAASGLGQMVGADPSRISQIAGQIGRGMNGIAQAGGAAPGYAADPSAPPAAAPVDNHLQLLDPNIIQQLIQKFGHQQAPQMGYAR